jgi:hypothetical protein
MIQFLVMPLACQLLIRKRFFCQEIPLLRLFRHETWVVKKVEHGKTNMLLPWPCAKLINNRNLITKGHLMLGGLKLSL